MADTRAQLEVEDWVRREWMPAEFGTMFHPQQLRLTPRGKFAFDAVSEDGKIVASISTSGERTAGGKGGIGKFMKLRSDMLFLVMVQAERRLIVLTERDMYERCLRERENGRVPVEIEFVHAPLPRELEQKLIGARELSSREVSPERG